MRRLLGPAPHTLLVLLLVPWLLVGCGSGGGETGTDTQPAGSSSPSPSGEPPESSPGAETGPPEEVDEDDVTLVHQTAAGGQTSQTLVPVEETDDLQAFLRQFRNPEFAGEVEDAVDAARAEGVRVTAAVVAVGCDVPPGVVVTPSESREGYRITPRKVADPLQECFAPVTTVAVVAVPA